MSALVSEAVETQQLVSSESEVGLKTPVMADDPFPFMLLPLEIRIMIYRLLLVHRRGFVRLFDRNNPSNKLQKRPALSTKLLRTCRAVHEEANRVIYSENNFIILPSLKHHSIQTRDSPPEYGRYIANEMTRSDFALNTMGAPNRALIRKVEILMPHPREVSSSMFKSMSELLPGLVSKTFFCDWYGVIPIRFLDEDTFDVAPQPTQAHYLQIYTSMMENMPTSSYTHFDVCHRYGLLDCCHILDESFLEAVTKLIGKAPDAQHSYYWRQEDIDAHSWGLRGLLLDSWRDEHGVPDGLEELHSYNMHYALAKMLHVAGMIDDFVVLDDESDFEDWNEDEAFERWVDENDYNFCDRCGMVQFDHEDLPTCMDCFDRSVDNSEFNMCDRCGAVQEGEEESSTCMDCVFRFSCDRCGEMKENELSRFCEVCDLASDSYSLDNPDADSLFESDDDENYYDYYDYSSGMVRNLGSADIERFKVLIHRSNAEYYGLRDPVPDQRVIQDDSDTIRKVKETRESADGADEETDEENEYGTDYDSQAAEDEYLADLTSFDAFQDGLQRLLHVDTAKNGNLFWHLSRFIGPLNQHKTALTEATGAKNGQIKK